MKTIHGIDRHLGHFLYLYNARNKDNVPVFIPFVSYAGSIRQGILKRKMALINYELKQSDTINIILLQTYYVCIQYDDN